MQARYLRHRLEDLHWIRSCDAPGTEGLYNLPVIGESSSLENRRSESKLKEEHGLDVRYVQLDIADISAKETVEKATGRLDRRPIPSSHFLSPLFALYHYLFQHRCQNTLSKVTTYCGLILGLRKRAAEPTTHQLNIDMYQPRYKKPGKETPILRQASCFILCIGRSITDSTLRLSLSTSYSPFIMRIYAAHIVLTMALSTYALPAVSKNYPLQTILSSIKTQTSLGARQGDVQGGDPPRGNGQGSSGPGQGPLNNSQQPSQNGPPGMNGGQGGGNNPGQPEQGPQNGPSGPQNSGQGDRGGPQQGHGGQNGFRGGNGNFGGQQPQGGPPIGQGEPQNSGTPQNGRGGPGQQNGGMRRRSDTGLASFRL
ncbi:uncharacterized protein BT62DRAFT_1079284 [Guyanagaster necrorhizus]|uniref:Uncharacterized protein n=1 Tax=Guyanagaster necrorhizus TaxID=856835 RepID=A0A9P7VJS7_9AGAR|nr:uncharacterized protein BT62DRAFT_1079284 [Guyanagaster necrorhizus MCA 3950]KAG7442426.1 hypothetical protein BT62DRAFT_1079284 [Guyanagaster necrorhizus MCA 3950]